MVRVFSVLPGTSFRARALRSARAPVGHVWTHCPQKTQADSFRTPSNSTVICVTNPRLLTEIA